MVVKGKKKEKNFPGPGRKNIQQGDGPYNRVGGGIKTAISA
jgi:hypothetical protein